MPPTIPPAIAPSSEPPAAPAIGAARLAHFSITAIGKMAGGTGTTTNTRSAARTSADLAHVRIRWNCSLPITG